MKEREVFQNKRIWRQNTLRQQPIFPKGITFSRNSFPIQNVLRGLLACTPCTNKASHCYHHKWKNQQSHLLHYACERTGSELDTTGTKALTTPFPPLPYTCARRGAGCIVEVGDPGCHRRSTEVGASWPVNWEAPFRKPKAQQGPVRGGQVLLM